MASSEETRAKRVVIIGAGLVGSLQALYCAKRGYQVDVYEYRPDPRTKEYVAGRSINLALSVRGREALREVGAESHVVERGIPMHSRMLHAHDGKRTPMAYGKKDQYILSIDRRKLNEHLINLVDRNPRVTYHFNEKFVSADFKKPSVEIESSSGRRSVTGDLIIGCDGAFSNVRAQLMKSCKMNYSQFYIPHGYKEIEMPPATDGNHAMEVNYLHIWPRHTFMMIALPNQDRTFTMTLFMPFEQFDQLITDEDIVAFFEREFPDAVPLVGREKLIHEFKKNPVGDLISIKCTPYHFEDKVLILGDAAHALVPFYGQGMNCGFEDCLVLDGILEKHNFDLAKALPEFSTTRNPDAEAIVDLAMYNYYEMRSRVTSRWFVVRKHFDKFLHWLLPNTWIPLYSMVTFSRIPYSTVVARSKKQDKVVALVSGVSGVAVFGIAAFFVYRAVQKYPHLLQRPLLTW